MLRTLLRVLIALTMAAGGVIGTARAGDLGAAILDVQHEWAHIHYQLPEDNQDDAYKQLEQKEDALLAQYPGHPEPMIWKAITLSTHAGVKGGFSALSMVRQARDLLLQAEKLDPKALDGSIYTSLGSLYYKVPGWPLGFGNDEKAATYLQKALQINPKGIDPNYFYGDYLYEQGRYRDALQALQTAMDAPDRPDRPVADAGRRQEVRTLLAKVKLKLPR
jgi:tetratricopeptide (TPR) repeat protein